MQGAREAAIHLEQSQTASKESYILEDMKCSYCANQDAASPVGSRFPLVTPRDCCSTDSECAAEHPRSQLYRDTSQGSSDYSTNDATFNVLFIILNTITYNSIHTPKSSQRKEGQHWPEINFCRFAAGEISGGVSFSVTRRFMEFTHRASAALTAVLAHDETAHFIRRHRRATETCSKMHLQ